MRVKNYPPTLTELEELGSRIWRWRAQYQPRTRDDIPRLERPPGWLPDFGPATVALIRRQRDEFAAELDALVPRPTVADVIDHRLLRSVLARVSWELDVIRAWQCQPRFYIDQALGTVFDALLPPGADADRVREVIRLLRAAPAILADGKRNLAGNAYAEFTALASDELADIGGRCSRLAKALVDIAPELTEAIVAGCAEAAAALADFGIWLAAGHGGQLPWEPLGERHYGWFLREVALMPFDPAELLAIGRLELARAITLEQVERNRRRMNPLAPAALPIDAQEQCDREARAQEQVRDFYRENELLSQPVSLGEYLNEPMPDYLEPLRFLGVADDLTSPSRLTENGVGYVPPPAPDLPYFYAANVVDPRAGIVHEGAHYQQLALSWTHPRPLRRHFYDSGPNEGIAFYNEEMMLTAGLFEDRPATRAIIYNFMRLRALRVTVDVGLATEKLTIEQAAAYLAAEVPMDRQTAAEEAAAFAEGPGQAISYQIGKTQVLALIADAIRLGGRDTDLQPIHDYLWQNGNVPIALCRWELLGLTDELDRIGVVPNVEAVSHRPPAAD